MLIYYVTWLSEKTSLRAAQCSISIFSVLKFSSQLDNLLIPFQFWFLWLISSSIVMIMGEQLWKWYFVASEGETSCPLKSYLVIQSFYFLRLSVALFVSTEKWTKTEEIWPLLREKSSNKLFLEVFCVRLKTQKLCDLQSTQITVMFGNTAMKLTLQHL